MSKDYYHIVSGDSKSAALAVVAALPENGRYEIIINKTEKTRSGKQNRSAHVYLRIMASMFVAAGIDRQAVFSGMKEGFSLPVTEHFLKELFKIMAEALTGKSKTSELTTVEMQEVYEAFNLTMGERYGISAEWPHKAHI